MASSSELTSPMTIFEITEQISMMNLTESSSSSSSSSDGGMDMDELISISTENGTTLMAPISSLEPPLLPPERKLSVAYTVSEAIVSLLAIFGNALVVYIFCKNRSLRRYRNYYIVALAIADFLVGLLGIPFAILASVGLPRNLYGCLFTVSILMVLCTISILCLVAVSIDRYWATTNPFAYYRNMTTTTAVSIILFCWVAGAIIGFLPMFGWYNREGWERHPSEYCFFTDVMDYSYLVFLYFATIVFPALLMIGFYGYIYHVVLIKIRQKGTFAPQHLRRFSEQSRAGSISCENRSATQVLRIMVSEKRREAKAAKKLGIIVLFFMLCWMPLYTINCIQAFYPKFSVPIELLNFTIILSHANSALNPFLYAYHLKEFRLAMKHALLALIGKLSCGLVNAHVDKEYPLGPMSRSLTMPSLGHVTTIPNPHLHTGGGGGGVGGGGCGGGKVSIKFRKIGRTTDVDSCRSVQISPTNHGHINNKHSMMMIPLAVNGGTTTTPPSRDNLLRSSVQGIDKSLTSLSMASETGSQILGIPLQQICNNGNANNGKNSAIVNGKSKTQKCNNGPISLVCMDQKKKNNLYQTETELKNLTVEKRSGSGDDDDDDDISTQANHKFTATLKSRSYSSLDNCIVEASTMEENNENDKDADTKSCGNCSLDNKEISDGDIINEEETLEERNESYDTLSPLPSEIQDVVVSTKINSHLHSNNNKEFGPVESSHHHNNSNHSNSLSESNSLKEKFLMSEGDLPMPRNGLQEHQLQQQQLQKNNFDGMPPESYRVSLDG